MESFKDFLKNKLNNHKDINEVRVNSFKEAPEDEWGDDGSGFVNEFDMDDSWTDEQIAELNNDEDYGPGEGNIFVRIDGHIILLDSHRPMAPAFQKKVLANNMENIKYIQNPTLEIQKYVIQTRPDLITKINNLDPKLRAKYSHEINTAGIDI